jgi:hypothetical protein
LKADRAFLVQLRVESDGHRRFSGRIEHVVSGESELFGSLAGLLDFMARYANPTARQEARAIKRPDPKD